MNFETQTRMILPVFCSIIFVHADQ